MNKIFSREPESPSTSDLTVLPRNDAIQVKNMALVVLTTIAVIFALDLAKFRHYPTLWNTPVLHAKSFIAQLSEVINKLTAAFKTNTKAWLTI